MRPHRIVVAGGPILTMDPVMPRASALLVEDGTIAAIYPHGTSPPGIPDAARLDLEGGTLLPGFVDAHTHFIHWGLRKARPDLGDTNSLSDALEVIRERHRSLPDGVPLIAEGWDESRWTSPRFPSRMELDAITGERPMVLRRVCGHMAVANGAALARIPPGDQVDADSGLLVEDASMGLARVFPPADEELDEGLAAAQASYHAFGVTAVHDMSTPDHLRAYARAGDRGLLRMSVSAILTRPHLGVLARSGLGAGWRRGRVQVWGVKLFMDGSLGARTAALLEPYADAPGERGLLLISPEELETLVRDAEAHAIPLAIHAIGDRAIETVVAAFETACPGGTRLGHRIEHLEMPSPGTLERMARVGLVASMQPNFIASWGRPGGMYEARLGPVRLAAMNPLRDVMASGVRLALGSDAMPAGVLDGIRAAVEAPFSPQRLRVEEALAGATREAAMAAGDRGGGCLRPGLRADWVVLNRDPSLSAAGDLAVRATFVAGERVFGQEAAVGQI
jgi:predicted amidohydrolase YtcJ